MSIQKIKKQRTSVARFLTYVLGRRPDEFGLFTDEDGWVPLKELIQALSEEEDWKFIRESTIKDLAREPELDIFEYKDKMIRVSPGESELSYGVIEAAPAPKLLYYAARRKGYPAILENGLTPLGGRPFLPLALSREMALRIGKRRDPQPILLTVHAEKAEKKGVVFYRPQELVYLVDKLDPEMFTGPPPPQQKLEPEKKKKKVKPERETLTPGSFFLEPDHLQKVDERMEKKAKKKRSDVPDWKRASRKERRKKDR